MDLFNLAQNMIAKEGIRQSVQRRFDVKYKNKIKNWWYHFNTLLMMISTQATGIPTGNHGLFHRYSKNYSNRVPIFSIIKNVPQKDRIIII